MAPERLTLLGMLAVSIITHRPSSASMRWLLIAVIPITMLVKLGTTISGSHGAG